MDNLRIDSNECDPVKLHLSVKSTVETLEKLADTMAELEYALYVDQIKY